MDDSTIDPEQIVKHAQFARNLARAAKKLEDYSMPCPATGCYLWTRTLSTRGYPRLVALGEIYGHRVAWVIKGGPIPAGMVVCHRCDVPACVNPDHLFLGTQTDNMRDCSQKGRAAVILTDEQVRSVRKLALAGANRTHLAALAGTSRRHVHRILRSETRRHVI